MQNGQKLRGENVKKKKKSNNEQNKHNSKILENGRKRAFKWPKN